MKRLVGKQVVCGFDGFVDSIVRPIADSHEGDRFFETIGELGSFLTSKAEKSCCIELLEQERKLGGNAPLFAHSIAEKGVSTHLIGMLGEKEISPEFLPLAEKCKLYTYAREGTATAMEFHDGKVFLMPRIAPSRAPFEKIQEIFDISLFQTADAVALLNWSELAFAHELWQAVYDNCLAEGESDKTKLCFFDLSDCSRKKPEEIHAVMALIGKFNEKRRAIVSLNENEALIVAAVLGLPKGDLSHVAKGLQSSLGIDEILIHSIYSTILATSKVCFEKKTNFVEKPVLSTGAGDNFNASYVFASLLGEEPEKRIEIANLGASFYVSHGYSATFNDVIEGE